MRCAHGKRMCPTIYVTGCGSASAQLQTRRQQSRRRAGRRAVVRAPAMGAPTAGTAAAGMCAHDEVCGRPPRSPEPSRPHTRRDATAACPRRLARRCRQQLAGDAPRSRGVAQRRLPRLPAPAGDEWVAGGERGEDRHAPARGLRGRVARVRALGVPSLLPPLLAHELGEGPPWPPAAQTPAPEPRERAQSRRSSRAGRGR